MDKRWGIKVKIFDSELWLMIDANTIKLYDNKSQAYADAEHLNNATHTNAYYAEEYIENVNTN